MQQIHSFFWNIKISLSDKTVHVVTSLKIGVQGKQSTTMRTNLGKISANISLMHEITGYQMPR